MPGVQTVLVTLNALGASHVVEKVVLSWAPVAWALLIAYR
jgi:hypothetical protein